MKTKSEWKRFENYCQEQTNGTFQVEHVPADIVDKLLELGKFFKDVRNAMKLRTSQTTFQDFNEAFNAALKS